MEYKTNKPSRQYEVKDKRKSYFFRVDNPVLEKHGKKLGPYGIAVYCVIALHAGKKDVAWPSRKRIAELTGMSEREVSRAFVTLEDEGLIEITKRPGTSHLITLLDPGLCGKGDVKESEGLPVSQDPLASESRPPLPVSPPNKNHVEQESNNKNHAGSGDFLDSLLQAEKDGVSEATGPNPKDAHFGYRDDFVSSFHQAIGRYPSRPEKELIVDLSYESGADVSKWKSAVEDAVINKAGGNPSCGWCIKVYRHYLTGGTWETLPAMGEEPKEEEYPEQLRHLYELDKQTGGNNG